MAHKNQPMPTVFRKPPTYTAGELADRRRIISKAISFNYASYGWRQPDMRTLAIDVEGALMTLQWIETYAPGDDARDDANSPLMRAYADARAQIGAPVPITAQFVWDCYNAFPDQGYAIVPHEHLPYQRQAPAAPSMKALPAPAGTLQYTPEQRAAIACQKITDPDLRGLFSRIAAAGLRAYDRLTGQGDSSETPPLDDPCSYATTVPMEVSPPAASPPAASPAPGDTRARAVATTLAEPMAVASQHLPGFIVEGLQQRAASTATPAPPAAKSRIPATSGRKYLQRLRAQQGLPQDIKAAIDNPRAARDMLHEVEAPAVENNSERNIANADNS